MIYREKILYFKIYFIFLYLLFMKQIFLALFSDFSLLYKHFLHWNISKVLISLFSFLLWLLFALPFWGLLFLLLFIDPIDWQDIFSTYYATQTIGLSFLTAISSHLFYVIFEVLLLVLWVLAFWFWSSYKLVLMAKLNLDYKAGTPTGFFKNHYFTFSKISKTIWIFSWIGVAFLALFFLIVWIFLAIIFFYWGIEEAYVIATQSESVSALSLAVLSVVIVGFLIFLYLAYRMNYSYIIMLDEKNYPERKSALFYVKESFKITSGVNVFFFFLVALVFSICIVLPVDYIGKYIEAMEYPLVEALFSLIIFLTMNGLFEMLLVSTYYSIMQKDTTHADTSESIAEWV